MPLPNSCLSLQPQYTKSGSGIDNMRMSVSSFLQDCTLSCSVYIDTNSNCCLFQRKNEKNHVTQKGVVDVGCCGRVVGGILLYFRYTDHAV